VDVCCMLDCRKLEFVCRKTIRCFFFFQAEDGIRDATVTGVQTCALPISLEAMHERMIEELGAKGATVDGFYYCPHEKYPPCSCRSEERRVGKESRSRGEW